MYTTLQVRAVNEFGIRGNWSDALHVSIPTENTTENVTVNTTQSTPTPTENPSPSSTTPPWVYVVPAVVVAIVAGILVIGGGVVLFRRYCFHRYVKMVNTSIYWIANAAYIQ